MFLFEKEGKFSKQLNAIRFTVFVVEWILKLIMLGKSGKVPVWKI